MTVSVQQIKIHPIKSLPSMSVDTVEVLQNGNLQNDRIAVLLDADGHRWGNVKHKTKPAPILDIHPEYTLNEDGKVECSMTFGGREYVGVLGGDVSELETGLSREFGDDIQIDYTPTGTPDTKKYHGPTICSEASAQEVGRWFGLNQAGIIDRMRPNIVLSGMEAFDEERILVGELQESVTFCIGEILFHGIKIAQRCSFPARDPYSINEGDFVPMDADAFKRHFTKNKIGHISEKDYKAGRMNEKGNMYRFGVHTTVEKVGTLSAKDELTLRDD